MTEPPILLSVVVPDGPVGVPDLLRLAIDAEHVGAGRLHLSGAAHSAELVEALAAHCTLLITGDHNAPWPDVIIGGSTDTDTVRRVADTIAEHPRGVSIGGPLPVLLAALAAGGHLLIAPAGPDDQPRPHSALVARAAGLARIAGRPAITGPEARRIAGREE